MKILKKNLKDGEVKFTITNLDDLWYLSHIIENGDLVRGKTTRKIKVGDKQEKNIKKTLTLTISAEKINFEDNILRISGLIESELEDVEKGSHQSINIEKGSQITLKKEKWLKPHLQKLDDASREKSNILICVADREEAYFAFMKAQGSAILNKIKGEVEKKQYKSDTKEFFPLINKHLLEYLDRFKLKKIIIGCSSVWKKDIESKLDAKIKKIAIFTNISGSLDKAIDEVLKSKEMGSALQEDRVSQEMKLVEEVLTEIAKQGNVEYGFEKVKECVEAGAVKILLITDSLLKSKEGKEKYKEIDQLMQKIEQMQGEVHIITSEHEGGKKLDGLGGIAALLRYKVR